MTAWLQTKLGVTIAAITLLSLLGGGILRLDGRYMKVSEAGEIGRQLKDLRSDVLSSRMDSLRSEEGAFLRETQHRRLTPLELQRLADIQRQLKRLELQIQQIEAGK